MHRTLAVALVVALVALAALAMPAAGQSQSPPTHVPAEEAADVQAQLVRLNRTLERIAGVLERQVEGQRLDLMLKRIELGNQRISTLESELRSAEEKERTLEDRQYEVQSRLKMFEDEIERMDSEQLEDNRQSLTIVVGQAERELDVIEARLQETEQRVLELQNEVTRRREDLRSLQDRLDRELGGM